MAVLEFDLPIYTYQIDFVGHVSNIVYIQWMEIGRTKLLEAARLPIETLARNGLVPVLTRTEIEYRRPLYLGDRVCLCAWLSELRHASARIEFRFYQNGNTLAAGGTQKGLFIRRDTMLPVRITPEMHASLAMFLAPADYSESRPDCEQDLNG